MPRNLLEWAVLILFGTFLAAVLVRAWVGA